MSSLQSFTSYPSTFNTPQPNLSLLSNSLSKTDLLSLLPRTQPTLSLSSLSQDLPSSDPIKKLHISSLNLPLNPNPQPSFNFQNQLLTHLLSQKLSINPLATSLKILQLQQLLQTTKTHNLPLATPTPLFHSEKSTQPLVNLAGFKPLQSKDKPTLESQDKKSVTSSQEESTKEGLFDEKNEHSLPEIPRSDAKLRPTNTLKRPLYDLDEKKSIKPQKPKSRKRKYSKKVWPVETVDSSAFKAYMKDLQEALPNEEIKEDRSFQLLEKFKWNKFQVVDNVKKNRPYYKRYLNGTTGL